MPATSSRLKLTLGEYMHQRAYFYQCRSIGYTVYVIVAGKVIYCTKVKVQLPHKPENDRSPSPLTPRSPSGYMLVPRFGPELHIRYLASFGQVKAPLWGSDTIHTVGFPQSARNPRTMKRHLGGDASRLWPNTSTFDLLRRDGVSLITTKAEHFISNCGGRPL